MAKCDEWWKLKYNTVIQELINTKEKKLFFFFNNSFTKPGEETREKNKQNKTPTYYKMWRFFVWDLN